MYYYYILMKILFGSAGSSVRQENWKKLKSELNKYLFPKICDVKVYN